MVLFLLPMLLVLPAACGIACLALASAKHVVRTIVGGVLATGALAVGTAVSAQGGGGFSDGDWLTLDPLSAYNLLVLVVVYGLASLYTPVYFREEIRSGAFEGTRAGRYGALWFGALAAMILVLISNNLGLMWVGMEGTTLLTAFLIYTHRSPASLEAMWKYLLICSVGVAFAFMGTLVVAASARGAGDPLVWTSLARDARSLDPETLKIGFLFLLVGYGTKAGLAPMHNWLPDAHSQAPAPVSAVFSGFMLNTALYCILRYVPIVEGATRGSGWSLKLLVVFGVLSILVAAGFIIFQHDVKRLLAYSSVEHIGIIALGFGLGGLGSFAALFHTLNQSLSKTLGFLSAGRLGQIYGTHDMSRISGTLRSVPVWGAGLLGSILALIGIAPFALFLSEFLIIKAAASSGSYGAMTLFLVGAAIVFVGALRHVMAMAWGKPEGEAPEPQPRASKLEAVLSFGPLVALLVLGVWMPEPLRDAISRAAAVLGGTP